MKKIETKCQRRGFATLARGRSNDDDPCSYEHALYIKAVCLVRYAVSVHVARTGSTIVIHRDPDVSDINISNSRVITLNMSQSHEPHDAAVAGQNFGWDGLKKNGPLIFYLTLL